MSQDQYCKMFIDCSEPIDVLYNIINVHLHGEKQGFSTIKTDLMELDLRENKEYIPNVEDFLCWRYYADIETWIDARGKYIDSIRSLISFLKSKNNRIVVACDFEDDLMCK